MERGWPSDMAPGCLAYQQATDSLGMLSVSPVSRMPRRSHAANNQTLSKTMRQSIAKFARVCFYSQVLKYRV